MPVNFINLRSQISEMGEKTLLRNSEMEIKLERCRALLTSHENDLINLQRVVEEESARNKELRCVVPVSEPLTTHLPCHLPAPSCTLLAADGSQINPDPHDSVLYGLVNIGIFSMQPGSGKTPSESFDSKLYYGEELFTENHPLSEDYIALLRDVEERQEIARRVKDLSTKPVVTLTDGPLELYREPRASKQFEDQFKRYLDALDELALEKAITAGYVSRPRADLLVALLSLLETEETTEGNSKLFAGISDITLLEHLLGAGERSAVFRLQSRSSSDYPNKKALHVFYLNVGTALTPAYARVEVPLWVAEDPRSIEVLHSVLVEQARQAGMTAYPYPLIRAHEIAVVKMDDRQQLTTMIEAELLKRGVPLKRQSEKQFHKGHRGRTRIP